MGTDSPKGPDQPPPPPVPQPGAKPPPDYPTWRTGFDARTRQPAADGTSGGGTGADRGTRAPGITDSAARGNAVRDVVKEQLESKGLKVDKEVPIGRGRRVDLAPGNVAGSRAGGRDHPPDVPKTIGKTAEVKSKDMANYRVTDLDGYRTAAGTIDMAKLTAALKRDVKQVLAHEAQLKGGTRPDLPRRETLIVVLDNARTTPDRPGQPSEAQQVLGKLREIAKDRVVGGVLVRQDGELRTASGHKLRDLKPGGLPGPGAGDARPGAVKAAADRPVPERTGRVSPEAVAGAFQLGFETLNAIADAVQRRDALNAVRGAMPTVRDLREKFPGQGVLLVVYGWPPPAVPILSFNRPGPRFDRVEVYTAPTEAEAFKNTAAVYAGDRPPLVLATRWFAPIEPGR